MASNRVFNFGPVALSATTTTNILNCAITSLSGPVGFTATQPYVILRHIHIANKTSGAVSFSLWKGATGANAAGTELWVGRSVPANDAFDSFGLLRFDAADFLVGGASAGTSLAITGEGEIGFL